MRRALLARIVLLASLGAPGPAQPNIVVVLADDLGWRDPGCYGSTFYETPHLDALAARGRLFRNAYAASPLCSPTRASLLTGLYPARHRITTPACHLARVVLDPAVPETAPATKRLIQPQTRTRLPNDLTTYAEVLREAGYRTAFVGKWHLGHAPYLPEQQGFDVVVGGRGSPGPPGGYFAPWKADPLPDVPDGTHIDDAITTAAIRFVEASREQRRPFLLNLWLYSVHAPFEAKPELIDKYRAKARRDPGNPQASPVMAAMIETMDANVGRLTDALDRLGIAEDTVVLFTSDNGGNEYDFADGVQVTSNAPLRNGKGNIHEGGQRVPFVACWPGRIPAGTTHDALVSSVDFFPSIVELAGLDASRHHVDGRSFAGALTGGAADPDRAIFVHFPHGPPATGSRPCTSVRRGDWKLLRFFGDGEGRRDRHALYDLGRDIGESEDLALREPDVVAELARLIDGHLALTEALVPRPNPRWNATADGWTAGRDAEPGLDRARGVLAITTTGRDPQLRAPVSLPKGRVTIELRARSTAAGRGTVYFADRRQPFHRDRSAAWPLVHDGEWRDYAIPLRSPRPIRQLRLDPGNAPGRVEIDWLRVIAWRSEGAGRVVRHWDF